MEEAEEEDKKSLIDVFNDAAASGDMKKLKNTLAATRILQAAVKGADDRRQLAEEDNEVKELSPEEEAAAEKERVEERAEMEAALMEMTEEEREEAMLEMTPEEREDALEILAEIKEAEAKAEAEATAAAEAEAAKSGGVDLSPETKLRNGTQEAEGRLLGKPPHLPGLAEGGVLTATSLAVLNQQEGAMSHREDGGGTNRSSRSHRSHVTAGSHVSEVRNVFEAKQKAHDEIFRQREAAASWAHKSEALSAVAHAMSQEVHDYHLKKKEVEDPHGIGLMLAQSLVQGAVDEIHSLVQTAEAAHVHVCQQNAMHKSEAEETAAATSDEIMKLIEAEDIARSELAGAKAATQAHLDAKTKMEEEAAALQAQLLEQQATYEKALQSVESKATSLQGILNMQQQEAMRNYKQGLSLHRLATVFKRMDLGDMRGRLLVWRDSLRQNQLLGYSYELQARALDSQASGLRQLRLVLARIFQGLVGEVVFHWKSQAVVAVTELKQHASLKRVLNILMHREARLAIGAIAVWRMQQALTVAIAQEREIIWASVSYSQQVDLDMRSSEEVNRLNRRLKKANEAANEDKRVLSEQRKGVALKMLGNIMSRLLKGEIGMRTRIWASQAVRDGQALKKLEAISEDAHKAALKRIGDLESDMQSSMKSHRQEKIQLASQFGLKEAALKDEIDMKDKIVVNVKKQVKEVATKGLGRAMQSVIDSLLATEVKKGVRFWHVQKQGDTTAAHAENAYIPRSLPPFMEEEEEEEDYDFIPRVSKAAYADYLHKLQHEESLEKKPKRMSTDKAASVIQGSMRGNMARRRVSSRQEKIDLEAAEMESAHILRKLRDDQKEAIRREEEIRQATKQALIEEQRRKRQKAKEDAAVKDAAYLADVRAKLLFEEAAHEAELETDTEFYNLLDKEELTHEEWNRRQMTHEHMNSVQDLKRLFDFLDKGHNGQVARRDMVTAMRNDPNVWKYLGIKPDFCQGSEEHHAFEAVFIRLEGGPQENQMITWAEFGQIVMIQDKIKRIVDKSGGDIFAVEEKHWYQLDSTAEAKKKHLSLRKPHEIPKEHIELRGKQAALLQNIWNNKRLHGENLHTGRSPNNGGVSPSYSPYKEHRPMRSNVVPSPIKSPNQARFVQKTETEGLGGHKDLKNPEIWGEYHPAFQHMDTGLENPKKNGRVNELEDQVAFLLAREAELEERVEAAKRKAARDVKQQEQQLQAKFQAEIEREIEREEEREKIRLQKDAAMQGKIKALLTGNPGKIEAHLKHRDKVFEEEPNMSPDPLDVWPVNDEVDPLNVWEATPDDL